MKLRKVLFMLLFTFVAILFLGTTSVKATEYEDDLIRKIAPDGKNAILKTIKPKDGIEAYFMLSNVVNELLNEEGYIANVYCTNDELTNYNVEFYKNDLGKVATYNINITYDEPEENESVNSILSKMKTPNNTEDFENCYLVSDLNLINLYKSGRYGLQNEAKLLKFSKEFIEIADGSDVSFYLETRAGGGGDMFSYAVGDMSLFYNGYCYGNIGTGIYLQNVIYIPENTKETVEAYIEAAQKRIKHYLGNKEEVKVSYGGTLESLGDYNYAEDLVLQKEKTDGNYYNVTIKDETYKFHIIKVQDEKLNKPKYKGKHIKSDIKITTEDSTVPLDTHLNVETVKNDEINKKIGTDIYEAYDIKLYSNIQKEWITKLENGRFLVAIPIGEKLTGKTITTYYINSNNDVEEYKTVVKDGIASFETDHFSTYILAERKEEQKKDDTVAQGVLPKAGIGSYIITMVIAVVVISILTYSQYNKMKDIK